MEVGACSDIGKVREINEDSYYISNDNLNLFIVADGMGGHNAGEVASNAAIHSIKGFMKKHKDSLLYDDEKTICKILKNATLEANKDIFLKSKREEACQGMGTTLTIVFILSKVYIAHVGDSRAHLIHNNNILQITKDHSLVAELLRNGSITENEAKVHPRRNMITRAVGTEENIDIDLYIVDFGMDDIILLCTDGLSNLIEIEEIKDVLKDCNDLQCGCDHLVELANERGGYDNITVVAIRK